MEEFEEEIAWRQGRDGWFGNNRIRIHITDANALANSIRRTILSDVPKMAITKVRLSRYNRRRWEILESVNVLPDEMLAHRLVMVLIPTYLDEFLFQDDPNNANKLKKRSPQSEIIYHRLIKGPRPWEREFICWRHECLVKQNCKSRKSILFQLQHFGTGQFLEFYAP